MASEQLALVLHGHLPYVRHPEHPEFLEELWLFEAITETYVPLLGVFESLADQGVRFRLTLSISPTLAAMLDDELLRDRYVRHLERLIELTRREVARTAGDPVLAPLARMYAELFASTHASFVDRHHRDLVSGFGALARAGVLELITTAATHAFLPLLGDERLVRAQVRVAVEAHRRRFGAPPAGLWLPECAYHDGLDRVLADAGLRYFFTDAHGILNATPRPSYSVYAPLRCPSGVAAIGRDPGSSRQVWSATEGYPGNPDYREFYRDLAYELDEQEIAPFLHGGVRTGVGIKYRRITGATEDKAPYDPVRARARAALDADHFLASRARQAEELAALMPERVPLVTAPYDAELFGHWWFEGPEWLRNVLRGGATAGSTVSLVTPGDYLAIGLPLQPATPAASSWGDKGHAEVWLNEQNDWIYRHLHAAGARLADLAERTPAARGVARRALDQAGRELLLGQASDWPFIMRAGTHVSYARRRVEEHLAAVLRLCDEVERGSVDEPALAQLESRHPIFPELDYRVFAGPPAGSDRAG